MKDPASIPRALQSNLTNDNRDDDLSTSFIPNFFYYTWPASPNLQAVNYGAALLSKTGNPSARDSGWKLPFDFLLKSVLMTSDSYFLVIHGDLNLLFHNDKSELICRLRILDRRFVRDLQDLGLLDEALQCPRSILKPSETLVDSEDMKQTMDDLRELEQLFPGTTYL